MLGMMLAAAALKTGRYDERLMKCLLGNLRIGGPLGFQPDRVDQGPLEKAGWQHYFGPGPSATRRTMQATVWACYLWAYRQTGFELFLQRAKTAIGMTMAAYPDRWVWTNGIQQERARMLLPLAWLVRVEDTPEHRAWLRESRTPCWPTRILAGPSARRSARPAGRFPPPASNEAYGTAEAPLIQSNGDAACDLLYTSNFALLALHEAAAATGDPYYRAAEDKLAEVPVPHPNPQRNPSRAGRRLVPRLRLQALGILGLQCRCGLGRLVHRERLDTKLDHGGAGPAADEHVPVGYDEGEQDSQAI